jgi:copper resistance protein B
MTKKCTLSAAIVVTLTLPAAPALAQVDPHAGHRPTASSTEQREPTRDLPPFIPAATDADREAAFPDLEGHEAHDGALRYFVLADQLEWQRGASNRNALGLNVRGWFGGDRDRIWFRASGEGRTRARPETEVHLLYGRQVSRWWDLVAGVRQDMTSDHNRTWLAFGVQGLAPYWFEIEATGYLSDRAAAARLEVEYELLITNRLVVQPRFEADLVTAAEGLQGFDDGIGVNVGVRVRYEFRRELAPYVGITWKGPSSPSPTAGHSDEESSLQLVTGLRLWF